MAYWQFKFREDIWNDWYEKSIGDIESWISPKIRGGKPNDISIGDIVFLYRTDKKKDRGIHFVSKVISVDFNDKYPIELKIINDLKENIFKPENFGFHDIIEKINKLNQRSTSYYKFDDEDNPQKLYDFIMNNETGNILAEELNQDEIKNLNEGAKKQIIINAYERSSQARKECLDYYGTKCQVCDFDFEKVYGEIGKDFIHVHHLIELSSIGQNYNINPIEDLRPVCPNCHAMLHKKRPAYNIEEFKNIVLKS